ncbi:MAG: 3-dehydroquinate synthase [Gammaproteobacteria bacterium]|nr:3-dehydroquinate synthase [Gammaproteobacteria bacterium]
MQQITVDLGGRSYPIFIGEGLLSCRDLWRELIGTSQAMIVTNATIEPLYLARLMQAMPQGNVKSFVIPDGESYKTLAVMHDIITQLLKQKFSRDCCLIALGGGVVGDITGFAAACYQRGVRIIQVPTTLLSQVDSSVGGKTAVNHELGKNMIGAFHQPVAVMTDIEVLTSLPDRELKAGLAEVIKYGIIRDSNFFAWLESNIAKLLSRDSSCLAYAIERSCINKAEVVAEDELEDGVRAILNLGHTFGHAIETGLNYKVWLHGEAVSMGMLMAADLSNRLGMLGKENVDRIRSLLEHAGLPVVLPDSLDVERLRELMSVDKKVRNGKLFLVLLKGIGHAVVTDEAPEDALKETLKSFLSTSANS